MKLLALCGRKQAGKNTSANYLVGRMLVAIGMVKSGFSITEKGELYVNDIDGDTSMSGIVDLYNRNPIARDFMEEHVYPYIKLYSFADILKEMCIELLGVSEEQCYGTDAQKDSPTHLLWENMPGVITTEKPKETKTTSGRLGPYHESDSKFIYHAPGPMTGREVLQFVGTEIFRRMSTNIWANATVNKILSEQPELAIITDCRFPNEVEAVQAAGGKVIRLLRDNGKGDKHLSETALDDYPMEKYDGVIDNKNFNIMENNEELINIILNKFEWFKEDAPQG